MRRSAKHFYQNMNEPAIYDKALYSFGTWMTLAKKVFVGVIHHDRD